MNCSDCPLLTCGWSFGGNHNPEFFIRCNVVHEYLFRISEGEAKMQDIPIEDEDSIFFTNASLKEMLPYIFDHFVDDVWEEKNKVRKSLIENHPCIATDNDILNFLESHQEWAEDQQKEVDKEVEELDRIQEVVKDAKMLMVVRGLSSRKSDE